jgi:hypothetical protein
MGDVKPNTGKAKVGARAHPPVYTDDNSFERDMIDQGLGARGDYTPPPQRTLITEPTFVKVATGILVFYRDGDRLLPEHEGLEIVPAVLVDGAYQPG